ncbi:MAG: PDZ domain-containing protein [Prolixibacteraceae bacterium]|nr:PDZ domain-containing protein [Burkholderiales bacterium]
MSDATPTGSPYGGFALGEDAGGGAVVIDVIAGPAALAGLLPGDRVEMVAGEKVGAARLLDMIRASSPGARLPLRVLRDGHVLELILVVGDRSQWATPSSFPPRLSFAEPPRRMSPVWLDEVETKVASAVPDIAPARERVQKMLDDLARQDRGFNSLRFNRQVLADPGTLIEWERRMVRDMQPTARASNRLVPLLCESLVLDCSAIHLPGDAGATPSVAEFAESIAAANRRVREAFAAVGPRDLLFKDLRYLLEETSTKRTLIDQPDSLRGIRAMQASMRVDFAALLDAFNRLIVQSSHMPDTSTSAGRKIPAALADMVEGEILDYAQVDGAYVVVGGPGPNRYRMDRLYAVIDSGGDDRYAWGGGVALETQTVIDFAGNDRYDARVGGPGAAWLGASVFIDLGGDDTYVSALGGCGAGAYGFGLLFDAAGADTYRCDAWSVGAGIYGAGVLIDAGEGWDSYISQSLSQGVGGPAGVGLLLDAAGDDLYRANGPVASVYATPTTFMSFSQGVGFGIRPYDHGGIGALIDGGGNDRYEGGEFSQGGGYFWGVGLLHDAGGNDLYYGGRYAQGFAAHQAAGLFTDMAGDDVYWAMRAAAQGAAWDQSIAMMFDGGGNDSYRAESLAQGAAAQQSRAWLFDAGGNDVYWSSGESAQGVAGDNAYHFRDDDPVVSLGVLLDADGDDRYSTGLANGEVRLRHVPGNPAKGRDNNGVAIDESP